MHTANAGRFGILWGGVGTGDVSLMPVNAVYCEFPVPWYYHNHRYQLIGPIRWGLENKIHSGSCKLIWVLFESLIQSWRSNGSLTLASFRFMEEGIEGSVHSLAAHTHSLPHYQHPDKSGTFVTTDEPMLTHHNHPKSSVYITVHSWCCLFYGFAQMYHNICPSLLGLDFEFKTTGKCWAFLER